MEAQTATKVNPDGTMGESDRPKSNTVPVGRVSGGLPSTWVGVIVGGALLYLLFARTSFSKLG